MSDYEKAKLNDIESYLRRETIQYLCYVKNNYGDVRCIENLKCAAYFVTDRFTETFNSEKSSEIKQWVYSNCSESAIELFEKYTREGKILSRKKIKITNIIKKKICELKKRKTNMSLILKRANYVIDYNARRNYVSDSEKGQLIVYNEYYVLGLSTLISWGLLNEYNGTQRGYISDKEIDELLNLAVVCYAYNDIIANWIFGDSSADKKFWNRVVIKEKQGNITDRIISFIEYEALNNAKNEVAKFNNTNHPDEILIFKDSLCEKVKEFFYSTSFTEEYYGISLNEWIKIYTFFRQLISDQNDVFYLVKTQLTDLLKNYGFNSDTAEKFIAIFSDNSKYDLFSHFLIENNGRYIVLPSIIRITEPLKSMMNLFSKNNKSGFAKKGDSFEIYVNNILQAKSSRQYIKQNLKDERDQHELDILMQLDDTLFIIECKTQFQHENIRGYYRNLVELDCYLKKFKLNLDYFTQDPHGKVLLTKYMQTVNPSFDLNNVKIVKVFIDNITYPFTIKDDVFIIDATKAFNFFKRIQPRVNHFNTTNGQLTVIGIMPPTLFPQNITDESFLAFLNNSRNYVIDYASAISEFEVKDLEKYGIFATRFIYDEDKYRKEVEDYIESHST